jgi:uncharacterized protein (TIGR01244 family)
MGAGMSFVSLDPRTLVSGQIAAGDIAAAAGEGVTLIVNNRPDGEEPGQPPSAVIEAAARAAGVGYRHLPVSGGIAPDQVAALAEVLAANAGKALLFCRSGTRSTYLWALAQSKLGGDPDEIVVGAAAAGYDVRSLRPYLG